MSVGYINNNNKYFLVYECAVNPQTHEKILSFGSSAVAKFVNLLICIDKRSQKMSGAVQLYLNDEKY